MTTSHRLAAIMFSDIVNYSAIAQIDEDAAAGQIATHRELIEDLVPEYGGEILQYYGDGSLTIFQSAVDAAECAIAIQQQLQKNSSLSLRIGIHLGEIYFQEDQFIGDGINVAARIQAEAGEGQVLISDAIRSVISNKKHLNIISVGTRRMKNIRDPLELFRIEDAQVSTDSKHGDVAPSVKKREFFAMPWVLIGALILVTAIVILTEFVPGMGGQTGVKTIAVLPFSSPGDDIENVSFSEGIADDVRSRLSSIQSLDVRSRASSAYAYENRMSARNMAKSLDIQYILEGSVRHLDDRLQLNLALIDAEKDQTIQPLHYETDQLEDLFTIQNDIVRMVLDLVHANLLSTERVRLEAVEPPNFDAHRNYLLGKSYLLRSSSPKDIEQSEFYFRQAIAEDSNYARAYAGLAEVLILPAAWGYKSISSVLPEVERAAQIAFAIDPDLAEAQHVIGTVHEFKYEFELAEKAFARAISLDPSHAISYVRLARVKLAQKRYEEAISDARKAAKLDPLSPVVLELHPSMYIASGQYREGIELCLEYLKQFPNNNTLLWNLGLGYALDGQYEKAIDALMTRSVSTADVNFVLGYVYGKQGDLENARRVLDYLLARNEQTFVPQAMIASVYYGMGDLDRAYMWLAQEEHYFLLLIGIFHDLEEHPRFRRLFDFDD